MNGALDEKSWSHGWVSLDDIVLHYVEAGERGNPLVILLHGFPEFWYSWRNQIGPLAAAGFHVLAPDLRGYNRSAKPTEVCEYHMNCLVSDVVGLVRHAGTESAHVVGHDWGGGIAWELAIRCPDILEKLVVMNMPHPAAYKRELLTPKQLKKSWYVGLFMIPQLAEWVVQRDDYGVLDRLFREDSTNPDAFTDADVRQYKRALDRPGALTAALNYYRALVPEFTVRMVRESIPGIGFDGPAPSTTIETPTLVVWGEQDRTVTVATTEELDRWVPNVQVERLPDASHWVQHDAPERVNDSLLDFLPGGA